jgi:hypothetical protein
MAIVNTLSTEMTNIAAGTPNQSYFSGGFLQTKVAVVELAADNTAESLLSLFRVPSNARIECVAYACDAVTTGTMDVGVYASGATSTSEAVDADEFASAVSIATAVAFGGSGSDITNEAAATDIAKTEMKLWERLGLSVDPQIEYDICATLKTFGTTAGTLAFKCHYVI